jgi:hypothetical protein
MRVSLTAGAWAVFAALVPCAATAAQPGDLYLPPDFAQVRPGLPPNAGGTPGGAYCGPTSAADLLQWLHDNGFTEAPGVRDPANVEAVTLLIGLLGLLMGTDPDGGTGSQAIMDAVAGQLELDYPGLFDVGFVGRSSDTAAAQRLGHRFDYIVRLLDDGYIALANVGWYVQEPRFPFADGVRCGGHWVAMTGYDLVAGAHTARFRDPAAEVDTVSIRRITDGKFNLMDADDVIREHFASSWNWPRRPNDCTLDVFGRVGIQDNVIYIGGVRLFSRDAPGTFLLELNLASGESSTHRSATGGTPTSIAAHPYRFDLYHCRPSDDLIFVTDVVSHQVTVFPTTAPLDQPRRLAFGHDEVLYVLQGGVQSGFSLLAIGPDGTLVGSATQTAGGAIACNEQRGLVYWWDPSLSIVRAFQATEAALQLVETVMLPSGVPFVPPGFMAVDDRRTPEPGDDLLYYNHDGSPEILRLDLGRQAPLPPIGDTLMTDPEEMVVDHRRHLFVAQSTTSPVLEFDADGMRVTASPAAALRATSLLAIIRASRRPLIENYTGGHTNADPPLDESLPDCNGNNIPDEFDVGEGYSADANGNGVPDECECPWDLDGGGTVGITDLLGLLAAWGTDPEGPPDFDGDGSVGITDLLELLAHWGPCP